MRFLHQVLLPYSRYWLVGLLLANLSVAALWAGRGVEPTDRPTQAQVPATLELIDATQVTLAPVATPLVCYAWGPFEDLADATRVKAQLPDEATDQRVISTEIPDDPDYLVFVDCGGSREQARRKMRELKELAIDSYVIARGDYVNTLSVGVFSRKNLAVAQRDRVEDLGYEVQLAEIPRSSKVHHLVARVDPDAARLSGKFVACDEIAPIQQFL